MCFFSILYWGYTMQQKKCKTIKRKSVSRPDEKNECMWLLHIHHTLTHTPAHRLRHSNYRSSLACHSNIPLAMFVKGPIQHCNSCHLYLKPWAQIQRGCHVVHPDIRKAFHISPEDTPCKHCQSGDLSFAYMHTHCLLRHSPDHTRHKLGTRIYKGARWYFFQASFFF